MKNEKSPHETWDHLSWTVACQLLFKCTVSSSYWTASTNINEIPYSLGRMSLHPSTRVFPISSLKPSVFFPLKQAMTQPISIVFPSRQLTAAGGSLGFRGIFGSKISWDTASQSDFLGDSFWNKREHELISWSLTTTRVCKFYIKNESCVSEMSFQRLETQLLDQ